MVPSDDLIHQRAASGARALRCVECNAEFTLEQRYDCPACGGILEIEYDFAVAEPLLAGVSPRDWADYNALLPLSTRARVTLGEGRTPLIEATSCARELGLERLWLKCEFTNPSGSYKDRPISIAVSRAVELGARGLILASSGNAASAAAAYAARAGLPAIVLVPEHTAPEKVSQAVAYGAQVVRIRGTFSDAYAVALQLAKRDGYVNLSTTFQNPYAVEGDKIIAYEIQDELGTDLPDHVWVPVGAGPMLVGIANGYRDMRHLRRAAGTPRLMAVQAAGCSPIVRAFTAGTTIVEPEPRPNTIAQGIADGLVGYPGDGTHTLRTVVSSGGVCLAVTDEDILTAQRTLATRVGVYVEPTAAAAYAGLARACAEGTVRGGTAVVILSGHGLKDKPLQAALPPVVDANADAVAALLAADNAAQPRS